MEIVIKLKDTKKIAAHFTVEYTFVEGTPVSQMRDLAGFSKQVMSPVQRY
uniref:Uncharacterized protein n=1 Tax=Arion vulgaris TaxID=1028688 RepID=A0A0B7A1G0_9EUPU